MSLQTFDDEIRALSQTEIIPINFACEAQPRLRNSAMETRPGIYVDLDGARLRKALAYLIRAMVRRCKQPGVYVSIEVIRKSHRAAASVFASARILRPIGAVESGD